MEEVYKTIEDYPNYQISNLGNVKNTKADTILKPYNTKSGYLHIDLFNENGRKTFTVHRLVASTFLDNPNNHPIINHINENKTDNRVENLEWCDSKYNINYGTTQIRRVEKKKIRILQYTKEGKYVNEWDSIKTASQSLNISKSLISECCSGKYKTAGGYVWKKAS